MLQDLLRIFIFKGIKAEYVLQKWHQWQGAWPQNFTSGINFLIMDTIESFDVILGENSAVFLRENESTEI
jgi:hypothetical protein